jgi:hypothetical protein
MPRLIGALDLTHQATPATPSSGRMKVYAKTGDKLYFSTAAGVERLIEPGVVFAFSKAGNLAVAAGAHRLYNDAGETLTIKAVRASVGTAPTGAAVIVDVNVGGTTIFSTQSNRPTIAISGNTSGKVTTMNTVSIADGAYFTIDIDQVGSTVTGADLTVQILC